MAPPPPRSASHYRRRILTVGGALAVLLYVIGAPIVNGRIEDDLERRVPDELTEAGFPGVFASFSGQDGTLRCEQPLPDPERAVELAYDVWGVRSVELDRSCRVNRAPTVATTTSVPTSDSDGADAAPGSSDLIDADAAAAGTTTTTTVAPTTVPPPDFDTVAEIVATSPDLSLLAVLCEEAGFTGQLAETDGVTLFAPTDAAFDLLPADAVARLRADPALLHDVLEHHGVAGRVMSAELVGGDLLTLDGGLLPITVGDGPIDVAGASITDADIVAGNGIVHVVDRVLVPPGVDLSSPPVRPQVTAAYDAGSIVLEGIVATEVERATLVGAATGAGLAPDEIVDRLTVDPEVGLDAATTVALGRLVEGMPLHLVTGVSASDGAALTLTGTYSTEADRDAMIAIAEAVGASAELAARPAATDADAGDLEAELNEYVGANPIRFEPTSAQLSDSADEVLDGIADRARRFDGVTITIEGHTDSDGSPSANLALSRRRAATVRDALIARGLDGDALVAEGFGSSRPVLVDGVEDKPASRRVEFRVVASA